MKYLLTSLVILTHNFTHSAWASSCQELRQELASIQHKLDTETLNDCSDQNKNFCCDKDDPLSCQTIYQAKLEYNDALAKLTILEGLVALGSAMEDKHNALRNLTPKQVSAAKENISDFLSSFNRANILQKSFELHGDSSLWDDYKGENVDQMQAYLNTLCVNPQAYQSFCTELAKTQQETLDKGETEAWIEVVETLQGFSEAHNQVLGTDRNTNFRNYKDFLKVQINGEFKDLSSLKKNDDYQKVLKLQTLITQYEKAPNRETLKEIQTLSNKIDEININYNRNSSVSAKFSDFAKEKLTKEATKLHSASGVFLNIEDTKNNFGTVYQTLSNELKIRKQTLDKETSSFVNTVSGLNCNGNDPIACIKEACKPKDGSCERVDSNKALFAIGINDIYKKIKIYEETEKTQDALENINTCFSGKERKKLAELPTCIKGHLDTIGFSDSIKKARENLAQKQKVLDFLQQGMPIRKHETIKAFLVNALHKKECIKRSEVSGIKSHCNTPSLNQQAQRILEFKGEVDGVLYDYDKKLFDQFLTDAGYTSDYKSYRQEFVELCKDDRTISNLCDHLEKEIISERPIKPVSGLSSVARFNLQAPSGREVEFAGAGAGTYVAAGLGSLAIMGVQAYIQTDMQNTYMENQVNAWNQQSYWNAQWNQWYQNRPNYMYSNWGFGAWNPGGLYNFNYNNDQMYYDTNSLNFSQFNFAAPSITQGAMAPLQTTPTGFQF